MINRIRRGAVFPYGPKIPYRTLFLFNLFGSQSSVNHQNIESERL